MRGACWKPDLQRRHSLSKAYAIISRFSEDIDLTISRDAPDLAELASPMADGISGKERARRAAALADAAQRFVMAVALPALAREIAGALGSADGWSLEPDPEDEDRQTLLFAYPLSAETGAGEGGYVKPRIKLEFGARGDTEPAERRIITPYLAEDFPDLLADASTSVPTLALERTFWEKATILHALHHHGKLREGMSRHYYDVIMLDAAGVSALALARREILEQVVRNKSLMFPDRSASYETAVIGGLRLAVTDAIRDRLARDYSAMGEMFFREPPRFAELVDALAKLEATINAGG